MLSWIRDFFYGHGKISSSELIELLKYSNLQQADAAIAALESGSVPERGDQVDAGKTKIVYERRGRHVAKRPTEHANQLAASCDELVHSIENQPDKNLILFHVPQEQIGSYLVWLNLDKSAVFGCLFVIGQRECEREELWGHEV